MSHRVSRRAAISGLGAGLAAGVIATPAAAVGAIKHYILVEPAPGFDMLALDRWYITFHAREVRRAFKAWQRNYVSYRSYATPPEAAALGVLHGRMTEIQFDSLADFRETRPNNIYGDLQSFTPPPEGGWTSPPFKTTTATVPVNPQLVVLSKPTPPKATPYLRWIVFFRYPKDVTAEAGDAWFKDVHAKELAATAGLKRLAIYQTVTEAADYPRVAEFWFDGYAAWRRAFIETPPRFAPPPWGGRFPFGETRSMFVGENPDIDFIHDRRAVP